MLYNQQKYDEALPLAKTALEIRDKVLGADGPLVAAAPEMAEPLYDYFVEQARKNLSQVATGSFRAMMQVELVNDGPVTILLDSFKLF